MVTSVYDYARSVFQKHRFGQRGLTSPGMMQRGMRWHPVISLVALSDSQIQVQWIDLNPDTGYNVERAAALAGPFTQIAQTLTGVKNYVDSGLTASTTYYYRVTNRRNLTVAAVVSVTTRSIPVPGPFMPGDLP